MPPRITVLGTGYLGATHAACLAELGFDAAIGAVAGVWDVAPLEVIGVAVRRPGRARAGRG